MANLRKEIDAIELFLDIPPFNYYDFKVRGKNNTFVSSKTKING
jgi:hypothetical protein